MNNRVIFRFMAVLAISFAFQASAFAQFSKEQIEYMESFLAEDNSFFKDTQVKPGWQNESAVVLAEAGFYSFERNTGGFISEISCFRRRLCLLDQAAIDKYSTFYLSSLPDENEYDLTRVNIIKANGTVVPVDFSEAVRIESVTAEGGDYSNELEWKAYYKLALKGLEKGDILDYYFATKNPFARSPSEASIIGVGRSTLILGNQFPTQKQRIEIQCEKVLYLQMRTGNGAPDFREITEGNERRKVYVLEREDVPAIEHPIWFQSSLSSPYLKFNVYQCNGKTPCIFYRGRAGEVKSSVENGEIGSLFNSFGKMLLLYTSTEFSTKLKSFMHDEGINKKSEQDSVIQTIFNFMSKEYAQGGLYAVVDKGISLVDKISIISQLSKILTSYKIEHQITAWVPRLTGRREDLLFFDELDYGLYFPEGGNFKYLFLPTLISHTLQDFDPGAYENEILAFEPKKTSVQLQTQVLRLPEWKASDHKESEKLAFMADPSSAELKIRRDVSVSGLMRHRYTMYFVPYFAFRTMEKPTLREGVRYSSQHVNYERFTPADSLPIYHQLDLEGDFDEVEADTIWFTSGGNKTEDPVLRWHDEFRIRGLMQELDEGEYLFSIGKLIGGQVELQEADMKREVDVYVANPRTYAVKLEIELPEGYEAEGLEQLNVNVDNPSGRFSALHRLSGGKLIIETEKVYKKAHVPASHWPEMVAFIKAARDFEEKKILLRKQ